MGTMHDQPVRSRHSVGNSDLETWIRYAKSLAVRYGITVADVIAAADVLERQRANELHADNGEASGGQNAGIGRELQKMVEVMQGAADVHDSQITGVGRELYNVAEAIHDASDVHDRQTTGVGRELKKLAETIQSATIALHNTTAVLRETR
jgi:hypothetical protein